MKVPNRRQAGWGGLLLLFSPFLSLSSPAQTNYPKFSAFKETTASAAAEVITLQLPARAGKRAELGQLVVYCTVDTTITIEVNGTTATTPDSVEITPIQLNLPGSTAVAKAYSTSNSTGGTVLDKITLFGESTLTLNLSDAVLPANQSTPKNITIRLAAFTGTSRVKISWWER